MTIDPELTFVRNNDKIRVFCYSEDDDKVFLYNFTEREMQETVTAFSNEIWFMLSNVDLGLFLQGADLEQKDNLKKDFVWFQPGVNKRHVIQCTCGNFLESAPNTENGMDKLAKLGYKHHLRTGHAINLRGN